MNTLTIKTGSTLSKDVVINYIKWCKDSLPIVMRVKVDKRTLKEKEF
jgi:hypothetical protein